MTARYAMRSADDDDARRRVLWAIPSALAVLGTVDAADAPHLMNLSWVTPVGNDPTRLAASVEGDAKSATNLREVPVFALSLLAVEDRELGRAFVKPDLGYERRGENESLHGESVVRSARRAPLLVRSVAALAGTAEWLRTVGDHELFLLTVEEVGGVEALFAGPASAHPVDVLRVQSTRMNYGK